MSTTPRTDAARGFHDMDTAVSAENMAQLETELAAAKLDAEDQAKWALWYLARAEKAEAECLEQARLLGVSGSREAALLSEIEQLEIKLARLYTDLERFTGHGLLDCHQICDQRDAAVAELAAEREKVRVLRYVLSRIFEAMPTKRDWLDPVLEKVALAQTKEDSK